MCMYSRSQCWVIVKLYFISVNASTHNVVVDKNKLCYFNLVKDCYLRMDIHYMLLYMYITI